MKKNPQNLSAFYSLLKKDMYVLTEKLIASQNNMITEIKKEMKKSSDFK